MFHPSTVEKIGTGDFLLSLKSLYMIKVTYHCFVFKLSMFVMNKLSSFFFGNFDRLFVIRFKVINEL